MEIKYRLYPHPVLWSQNDDYMKSEFECEMDLHKEIKCMVLYAKFNLKDEYLERMISRGDAEYIIHIECPASSYRLIKATKENFLTIKLGEEHLLGKVSCCPFIVAKRNITEYINPRFNDDYKDVKFNLSKGSIMAIGEQQIFTVDKSNDDLAKIESIFTIYKKETTEQMPMEVELNDNKIRIGLNISDYENYYTHVQSKFNIINAFIIYPTLIYTFEKIKENLDEYCDYRWYRAIEKILSNCSIKLDEDLLNSKTSIELAQQILDLPVSRALVDVGTIDNSDEED